MTISAATPTSNITPDIMMPSNASIQPDVAPAPAVAPPSNASIQPDVAPAPAVAPTSKMASVSDVMTTINDTLRSAGGAYIDYACKTVSWDDVTRGTVGGQLSCWGSNITDTRLYEKSGKQLYTVRSQNFNEKLGKVTADELALITGNQQPGGSDTLSPITLRDFLRDMGKHGSYAGLDKSVNLSDAKADTEVSIRFMTTFLPVADESLATLEFAPEMYSYQSRSDTDPANLLLLATSQGVAVQANGAGATKMYHHSVEPNKKINRYWFEAERSEKKVGGAQIESKEEALAAAKRGKATASVIGTRAMGTRFNVLMTIQVPLKQQPPPRRRGSANYGFGGGGGGGGGGFGFGFGFGGGMTTKSAPVPKALSLGGSFGADTFGFATAACSSVGSAMGGVDSDSDGDWSCDVSASLEEAEEDTFAAAAPTQQAMSYSMAAPPMAAMRCARSRGSPPPRPRVGTANAARVSRGSLVDKLDATVKIAKPVRDSSQHITVTVVIYNTVAGGVPSVADVQAAVDDMEQLYASCGWKGRLASEGADFMKKELTVKDAMDISEKLTSQPYVPPVAQNLVAGGNIFPTSTGAA